MAAIEITKKARQVMRKSSVRNGRSACSNYRKCWRGSRANPHLKAGKLFQLPAQVVNGSRLLLNSHAVKDSHLSLPRPGSKSFAVVIPLPNDQEKVIIGTGKLEKDDEGCDVLRVDITPGSSDPAEDSAILVKMHPLPPIIEKGRTEHGCDHSVFLSTQPQKNPRSANQNRSKSRMLRPKGGKSEATPPRDHGVPDDQEPC